MVFGDFHQNGFDVFPEAHVQHFVRFVQNHHLYGFHFQCTTAHVVHNTARCTNDNLRTFFQCQDLTVNRLTTVNGHNADVVFVFQQFPEFLADLNRQFSGRAENQCLQTAVIGIDTFQTGNAECGCFACTCLRLTDDVFACFYQRNCLGLDGSCFFKTHIQYSLVNFFG